MDARRNRFYGRNIALGLAIFIILILFCALMSSRKSYKYRKESIKISELLSASIHLAELSGRKIVEVRNGVDPDIKATVKSHTDEGAKEYVTLGDRKSHAVITGGFMKKWPQLNVRSEENGTPRNDIDTKIHNNEISKVKGRDEEVIIDDIAVWVDPLDATQEYTEGGTQPDLLQYVMVMICITVDGYPVAGVLHQPFIRNVNGKHGITYWGWVNHGVSESLTQPTVDHAHTKDRLTIISSRSHTTNIAKIIKSIQQRHQTHIEHLTAGGAGYKTVQVLQDKANAYLHASKIKKWDTCASNAIVNAMGGVMTTLSGDSINYGYKSGSVINDGLLTDTDIRRHQWLLDNILYSATKHS